MLDCGLVVDQQARLVTMTLSQPRVDQRTVKTLSEYQYQYDPAMTPGRTFHCVRILEYIKEHHPDYELKADGSPLSGSDNNPIGPVVFFEDGRRESLSRPSVQRAPMAAPSIPRANGEGRRGLRKGSYPSGTTSYTTRSNLEKQRLKERLNARKERGQRDSGAAVGERRPMQSRNLDVESPTLEENNLATAVVHNADAQDVLNIAPSTVIQDSEKTEQCKELDQDGLVVDRVGSVDTPINRPVKSSVTCTPHFFFFHLFSCHAELCLRSHIVHVQLTDAQKHRHLD